MKRQLMMKISAAVLFVVLAGLVGVACGGDQGSNNGADCSDGEVLATYQGTKKCYPECTMDSDCGAGLHCQGGSICVGGEAGTNNGANNGNNGSNNGTTGSNNGGNNGSNNGTTGSNNGSNNGTNSGTNNGTGGCMELDPPIPGANGGASCDPICQTGCGMDEACVAGSSGPGSPIQSSCQPAGTGMQGDSCSQMSPCAAGYGCAGASADTATCQQYCDPNAMDPGCDDPDAMCSPLQDEMRLGVCAVPEDACSLTDDMCPQDQKCAPTNLGLQCVPAGTKMAGDTCAAGDCARGLVCVNINNNSTCRKLCDPNAATNDCAQDQSCNTFSNTDKGGFCL